MEKRVVEFSCDSECAEAHEPSQVSTHLKIPKMSGNGHLGTPAQQMPKRLPILLEYDVLVPVSQVQASLRPCDFTYHQQ